MTLQVNKLACCNSCLLAKDTRLLIHRQRASLLTVATEECQHLHQCPQPLPRQGNAKRATGCLHVHSVVLWKRHAPTKIRETEPSKHTSLTSGLNRVIIIIFFLLHWTVNKLALCSRERCCFSLPRLFPTQIFFQRQSQTFAVNASACKTMCKYEVPMENCLPIISIPHFSSILASGEFPQEYAMCAIGYSNSSG